MGTMNRSRGSGPPNEFGGAAARRMNSGRRGVPPQGRPAPARAGPRRPTAIASTLALSLHRRASGRPAARPSRPISIPLVMARLSRRSHSRRNFLHPALAAQGSTWALALAPRPRTPCGCSSSNYHQARRPEGYPSWPQRPARPTTKRTPCAVYAQFSFWLPCRLAAYEKWIERKALRPDSRPSREILHGAARPRPKHCAALSKRMAGGRGFFQPIKKTSEV